MKKFLLIILSCFLFISCKSNLVGTINKNYKYEYSEEGFSEGFADCIRKSRESLLNLLLEKNIAKKQRVYIIEIYGNEVHTLQAKIIAERFNYDFTSKGTYCDEVERWYPEKNYSNDYYDFLVKMAREERFDELKSLYKKHPISNRGLVYLTVVDFKENINNYELIKTVRFTEFRVN